jgi:four helix bundle protein
LENVIAIDLERDKIVTFENLDAFKLSYDLSLRVHKLSRRMPKEEQYSGIADQIRRSSKSICANISEGFARRHMSTADFKRFLMIAFGSCEETRLWLRYAKDLQMLHEEEYAELNNSYIRVAKLIFGLHKKWK